MHSDQTILVYDPLNWSSCHGSWLKGQWRGFGKEDITILTLCSIIYTGGRIFRSSELAAYTSSCNSVSSSCSGAAIYSMTIVTLTVMTSVCSTTLLHWTLRHYWPVLIVDGSEPTTHFLFGALPYHIRTLYELILVTNLSAIIRRCHQFDYEIINLYVIEKCVK
jgi:hypothetical protein